MESSNALLASVQVEVVGDTVFKSTSAIFKEKEGRLTRKASILIDFRAPGNDAFSLLKYKWRSAERTSSINAIFCAPHQFFIAFSVFSHEVALCTASASISNGLHTSSIPDSVVSGTD